MPTRELRTVRNNKDEMNMAQMILGTDLSFPDSLSNPETSTRCNPAKSPLHKIHTESL